MKHIFTMFIPEQRVKELQSFLDGKGGGTENTVETITAVFGDLGEGNIEVDIKICDGKPPFIDPVIFQDGHELSCLDVADKLEGEYIFESVLKDTYTVVIVNGIKNHSILVSVPETYTFTKKNMIAKVGELLKEGKCDKAIRLINIGISVCVENDLESLTTRNQEIIEIME